MASANLEVLDHQAHAHEAAAGAPHKRAYVQHIFSEIAPRYDLLNRLLSLGVDRGWRRAALAALGWDRRPSGIYLDLCAGTLDVSAALGSTAGFTGEIVAADFAEPMLRSGLGKAGTARVAPVVADALTLPMADASCDGALVAFGIRNVADLPHSLAEVRRVLKPGARFVILELSTPSAPFLRGAYLFYFRHLLPLIGGIVSGHPSAYRYLPRSVMHFPEGEVLARLMREAGYASVSWRPLTFGIAALHVGERA